MTDLKKFAITPPARKATRLLGSPAGAGGQPAPTLAQIVARYDKVPDRDGRCMLLFDATSSMQPYWTHVRSTLQEIVRRLLVVQDCMSLKIVAYRDDCDGVRIIEASEWSGDAGVLTRFVGGVVCAGGGDVPEAVDRALAVALSEQEAMSAVVLIGDAPPHANRDAREEARALGQQGRRVFPIVVGGAADTRQAFAEIARLSGGTLIELDKLDELYDVLGVIVAHSAGAHTFDDYLTRYQARLTPGGRRAARLLTDGRVK